MPKIVQLSSGNYRAQVYSHTEGGKRKYKSFTASTKTELKRLVAHFQAEKHLSSHSALTVADAIESYLDTNSNIFSPSSMREFRRVQRKDFQSIMNIPIERLTVTDLQAEINAMSKTLSPKSVANRYGMVRAAIKAVLPEKTYRVNLPEVMRSEISIPTEDDVLQLLSAVKDTILEVPVALAAFCGLRRSEICALKWSDIDMTKRTATIHAASVQGVDQKYHEKPKTKSAASSRTIYLFDVIYNILAKQESREGNVTSLNPNALYKRFLRTLNGNGIRPFRFHDLRHYAVSVMLALNIPKKYIADYVGHETERMIDRVYGHVFASQKDVFYDRIDGFYNEMQHKMQHE